MFNAAVPESAELPILLFAPAAPGRFPSGSGALRRHAFSSFSIKDPDLAGLTTINEGALGYMPGASASLPTYNYVPYISFSIDGVKLRFTVRARTRDGRQFRDFIAEKILPKGEDGD